MKKLCSALVLCCVLAGSCFAGEVNVVTTIFPIYDWVRELSQGSGLKVTFLLDSGVDLHSYQPAVEDMAKIAVCDMFIYVGGESDEWVKDAVKSSANPKQSVINLLEVLGDAAKTEEIVEGMEQNDHEEEAELDEHIWLSLRNAGIICRNLAGKLSEIDPEHKEIYSANLSSYLEKLSKLDKAYVDVVASSQRKILLFGDRFPFRYLTDDYGLKYYAAFAGCSAETEASFETVVFLAGKVNEFGLPCVMTIEGTNHKIAQTITASTEAKNQKILVLNSMQSTTAHDVERGTSYLSIMSSNLDVLKEALN